MRYNVIARPHNGHDFSILKTDDLANASTFAESQFRSQHYDRVHVWDSSRNGIAEEWISDHRQIHCDWVRKVA